VAWSYGIEQTPRHMNDKSKLMRILLRLGFERLAWACRRLYCPVPKSALVLEVGSGGSPYYRANILIDAYEETRERHWVALVKDRPSLIGRGEALPFKDKCFDFVIASHVVEHSSDPEHFLNELQRVAKAGYIETPDALMERINPYWDHRSEITARKGVLIVKKKPNWLVDAELTELYEEKAKTVITQTVIPKNPFVFHTRFYWRDYIPYKIINPHVDATWEPHIEVGYQTPRLSARAKFGKFMLSLARWAFSQTDRNNKLKLANILQCPECKTQNLAQCGINFACTECGAMVKTIS